MTCGFVRKLVAPNCNELLTIWTCNVGVRPMFAQTHVATIFSDTLQKKFTWHLQLLASICGNNQILEWFKVINRLRPQMSNVKNNSLQYTSVYSPKNHVLEIDGSNILKIHHTWPVLWRLGSPMNGGIEGFHLKSTLEKHPKKPCKALLTKLF